MAKKSTGLARTRHTDCLDDGVTPATWARRKTKQQAAKSLLEWGLQAIHENLYKAQRAYRFASLFEGFTLTNLSSFGAEVGALSHANFEGLNIPIIRNRCRRFVYTFVNKSFASENPLPQFTSKGGTYDQALKAENMDDAINAEFNLEHGQFGDIHEMHRHGGLIATAATGRYYIFALPGEGKVEAELDDSLTVGTTRNGQFGRITGLVRTLWKDPEALALEFPKHADKILDKRNIELSYAPIKAGTGIDLNTAGKRGAHLLSKRTVRVVQGWLVQPTKEHVGRVMYVLQDGTILKDDRWEHPKPPCVYWDFETELGGEAGTPLTQTIYRQCMRQNEVTYDLDRSQVAQAQVTYLVQRGTSEAATIKGQLQQPKGINIVELDGPPGSVQVVETKGLARNGLELIDLYDEAMHDDTGIAKNHTGGQRSVGSTSGVQESLVASYFTENFSEQERRLVLCRTVGTARIFLWALQEVVDDQYERWPGDVGKKRQLKGADLDLDEDRYVLEIKPVGEGKDTPKARLEKAEQWLKDPTVQFTGSDMAQMWKTFDTDRTMARVFALQDWAEKSVKKWLKASDDEMLDPEFYQSPEKWMQVEGLQSVLSIVMAAFLDARESKVPGNRLDYFTKFMDECVVTIDFLKKQEAALMAPPAPQISAPPGATPPVLAQ